MQSPVEGIPSALTGLYGWHEAKQDDTKSAQGTTTTRHPIPQKTRRSCDGLDRIQLDRIQEESLTSFRMRSALPKFILNSFRSTTISRRMIFARCEKSFIPLRFRIHFKSPIFFWRNFVSKIRIVCVVASLSLMFPLAGCGDDATTDNAPAQVAEQKEQPGYAVGRITFEDGSPITGDVQE